MAMKAGFAGIAALAAAGCSFSIGTEDVFNAQDSGYHAASVAEMRMNGEEALAPAAIVTLGLIGVSIAQTATTTPATTSPTIVAQSE